MAARFLAETQIAKRYVAVDTFAGFVDRQFEHDLTHGTEGSTRTGFARNSLDLVRRQLDAEGYEAVELLKGDVSEIAEHRLPPAIAVCLLDVDLDIPTYDGLRKVAPRLGRGGVLLVDDCHPSNAFAGARAGYRRFVAEAGVPEEYFMNMGVVRGA